MLLGDFSGCGRRFHVSDRLSSLSRLNSGPWTRDTGPCTLEPGPWTLDPGPCSIVNHTQHFTDFDVFAIVAVDAREHAGAVGVDLEIDFVGLELH